MVKIDLKGQVKEFDQGVTAAEVAKSIGMGLYKSACAAKIDGEVCDLRTPIEKDCSLEILTFDTAEGKHAYWHTTSHIMAQAVMRLYPGTKFSIGPAIENGFYYDFDIEQPLSTEDLPKIEAEMKKIIKGMRSSTIQSVRFLILVSLSISTSSMVHNLRQLSHVNTQLTGNVGTNHTTQSMMKRTTPCLLSTKKKLRKMTRLSSVDVWQTINTTTCTWSLSVL